MRDIKYEVEGSVLRFFANRADAFWEATRRTRLSGIKHEVFEPAGYHYPLVHNARGQLFDNCGQVPDAAADVLLNYVLFGDVARDRVGEQCQYAHRYLDDPEIGMGTRWRGRHADYHGITIHRDDVAGFVERALMWRRAKGIIL